jgi:hypothetical protein
MSEEIQTTYRSNAIYVRPVTRKALAAVAQGLEQNTDGLAEWVLTEWLHTHHAEVSDFYADREKKEREFKKGLKEKLKPVVE